jgi:hypothetical protein
MNFVLIRVDIFHDIAHIFSIARDDMHVLKPSQTLLLTNVWKYIFVDYMQEKFQVYQRVTSSHRSTTRLGLKYHYEIYQNLRKKHVFCFVF